MAAVMYGIDIAKNVFRPTAWMGMGRLLSGRVCPGHS